MSIKFGCILCEQCRKTITYDFDFKNNEPTWERIKSPVKKRVLDFCDQRCRMVYLRGYEYYRRKLAHELKATKSLEGN